MLGQVSDGPKHNDARKAEALKAKAARAHAWRVQVWAQSELRLRSIEAELKVLGYEPDEPFSPDFEDEEMLRHYSEMQLPK